MNPIGRANFSLHAESSTFRVENYNLVRPFSSFLPGIAGAWGIPAWVYWVTRGQAISGVGVGSRDGQILELYSFNKAVGCVEREGFRTFLRLEGQNVPEPFRRRPHGTAVDQTLIVTPHEIALEHTDSSWGVEVRVIYHTIPNRRIPGLVRSVTVADLTGRPRRLRQNQLGNIIRGGMPLSLEGSIQSRSTYVFSHQDADLERDYHQFDLSPTCLSAGLGFFRDTLQNRRDDAFFQPDAAAENLRTFFGLIQLDCYNPLEVLPPTFICDDHLALKSWASKVATDDATRAQLVDLMAGEFGLGLLAMWVEDASGRSPRENIEVLSDAMEFLVASEIGGIHAGYWIDHWHYLVDLLDSHLGVFPDNTEELLLEREYTWFDSPDVVVPQSERYVATPSGMRQHGSVVRDRQKEAMIAQRSENRSRAHTLNGDLLRSSLLEKLVLIAATRLATLDSSGIGIEMEAGKPGWNDSLNGLPGLFGSGLSESIELRRLLRLLNVWLGGLVPNTSLCMRSWSNWYNSLAPCWSGERVVGRRSNSGTKPTRSKRPTAIRFGSA